jgi:hypothetical protein
MTKKTFFSTFLIVLILFISSCSDKGTDLSSYRDESGNFIIEREGRRSISPAKLPAGIPYNDSSISLEKVEFYQTCSNYSYTLFIIATLDVSSLTDTQLHWLRESDIKMMAYITSEKNGYDFERAPFLGSLLLTDSNELVFVTTSSFLKENRYGFEESDIVVALEVTQEETYVYKNSNGDTTNLNKIEEISYKTTTGTEIPDAETIGEPLYSYMADWLYSKAS